MHEGFLRWVFSGWKSSFFSALIQREGLSLDWGLQVFLHKGKPPVGAVGKNRKLMMRCEGEARVEV